MASPSFPDATRIPSRSLARAGVTLLFSGLLACTGAIDKPGSGSPGSPTTCWSSLERMTARWRFIVNRSNPPIF